MSSTPLFVILVAEDDEDDRHLLAEALARHEPQCQIRFFLNGLQLLNAMMQPESRRLPTLAMLDLNMPIMDGLSTLKRIKGDARLRSTPVLILTTSDAEEDIMRCYDAGANAYMTKPPNYQQLAELTDKAIDYWIKAVQLPSVH